ncbi:MAG: hypothetical protein DRJ05_00850, partial [Bacteroidetes bacterium]
VLSAKESLDILDSLKNSKIYRPDQYSYMLYPDRQLLRFMEKNVIPEKSVKESALFQKLLEDKETSIIKVDKEGICHFNGTFRNAAALEVALNELRVGSYSHLIEKEKDKILAVYEGIFDHQSFTGRSGTFYGYEGLGSIYWHMVSKLLLATQECYLQAIEEGADNLMIGRLKQHYYEIKAGIGLYKAPDLYGGFPTDAYSHTPSNSGVKQPGLTGQVKEDIISRMGELGIFISHGKISFDTILLNKEEILEDNQVLDYFSLDGKSQQISLNKNQIGFTFCQVPIVYTFSDVEKTSVIFENGSIKTFNESSLDQQVSNKIFNRSGEVKKVEVSFKTNKHVR